MNKKSIIIFTSMTWIFVIILLFSLGVQAAKLELNPISKTSPYVFTLAVDKVEKLAGMKLTIIYPEQQLQFQTATKAPAFSSFMHVVNDKTPGKLIIVMASAQGVSGNNINLFKIAFSPLRKDGIPTMFKTELVGCQLMSEMLQEITCETSLPSATSK